MINRLIRNFTFDNAIRSDLVFSDPTKIRLNTENEANTFIQLTADSVGKFSTDADLFIEGPLITPEAVQKWLKFEAIQDDEANIPAGTSLGFKVKTTSSDFYWDGAAWVVAGLSDWMTEADFNANFDTFPIDTVGDRSIGVIVNLVTTDDTVTPKVKQLKLLGEFDIEFLEDIIYDGVIRTLNTSFRSTGQILFSATATGTSVDLNTVLENKSYNITGIRKVINQTDDPLKLTNLFSSYTPGASRQDGFTNEPGTVDFTVPIASGKIIEITFEHVPTFSIRTGQDFFQVPNFPHIVFESIQTVDRVGFTVQDTNSLKDFIRDKAALSAVVQFGARQEVLRFNYALFTNSQLDQMRISNDLNSFFANNRSIKSFGLDCDYDLDIVQRIDTSRNKASKEAGGVDDRTDTNTDIGSFELLSVNFYDKPSIDVPLVSGINLDLENLRL